MNFNESINGGNGLLPEGYRYSQRGYLWFVLPIEKFAGLPEEVVVDDNRLFKKKEFHATVINGKGIANDIAGNNGEKVKEIEIELQQILYDYIKNSSISFDGFEDDLRLAKKDDMVSIAAICRLGNIDGYFEQIKNIYGKQYPVQPAHVSIYTLADGLAVGIDSVEQIKSYEKISLPEVQKFLSSVDLSRPL